MSFEIGHTEKGTPVFTLGCNGQALICTPENTAAFVHDQRFKDTDHIFIETSDGSEDGTCEGMFIFRGIIAARFNEVVEAMEAEGYNVNKSTEPSKMDWEQFVIYAAGDLDNWWDHLEGGE